MNATTLLAFSLVLQVGAALAALRMITLTGRRWAWVSVAVAIGLMGVRRGVTLYRELAGDNAYPPDLAAEYVAVLISALMFAGLTRVGPVFRSIRRAERTRAEAMARFTHLSETTREGVVFHEAGHIVECNSAFAQMMGYARAEIIGMEVPRFVAPDSRELVLARLKEGYDRLYEHRALRKDGTTFDVEACGKTTVIEGRIIRVTTIRDITERKNVEKSLRNSERAMSTLLSNLPGVAYRCLNDRAWTMEFVSNGCRALTGYDADEVLGNRVTSFGDMQHPHDRERVWIDVQKCLEDKTPFRLTYRIMTKPGVEKWVWEQGVGIYSESGALLAIEGFITDITERVHAEQALRTAHDELDERVQARTADLEAAKARLEREIHERTRIAQALKESEEKFRLLCTSAPIGIFLTDPIGATVYANPRLLEIACLTQEEAMGWGWLQCVHPDDEAAVSAAAREAARTGESFDAEFRIRRKDGEDRWVHACNIRIVDPNGTIVGKVGTVEDITRRKLAQIALSESEERLQGILDNSPAVIYAKHIDGRYTLINRKYEQLFNISREEMVGKTDAEIFPAEVAAAFRQNDQLVFEAKIPVEFEETVPQNDGLHTYISLKFPLLGPDGVPYAVCGISTDITDRKRASEAMERAKEEAETASRAKTVFLANVSHELKTPIMAMMGSAELLGNEQNDTALSQRSDVIMRNARHLIALVDRILDLARVEADRLEVRIEGCSAIEILQDVWAASIPRSNVEFRIIVESDLPCTIRTDATRVRQAVINLVSNALKFTLDGYVHVRAKYDSESGVPKLVVIVEDSGPGIEAASLEHIFAPFTQLAPDSGVIAQGVGLGLPLARSFARQLGGDVTVESALGKGSRFTLSVHAEPAEGAEWMSAEAANGQVGTSSTSSEPRARIALHGSVLLAEDYRDTRELIRTALEQAGVDVTAVSDGAKAVRAARDHHFDLILLDVRMPHMDGLEAAQKIRSQGATCAIIALTASIAPNEKRHLLEAGFDDLWTKPIRLSKLLEEISAYLESDCPKTNAAGPGSPNGPRGAHSDLKDKLAAANADYARLLPARVATVRDLIRNEDPAGARELLHQLAGSGGMHGFMAISDEAGRLLRAISNGEQPDRLDLSRLLREAEAIAKRHGGGATAEHGDPTIPDKD